MRWLRPPSAALRSLVGTVRERIERGDRGTARTGHVQVWNEREGSDLPLLVAQDGVLAYGPEEPLTEMWCCLDNPTSQEVRIRVGEVCRDCEQPPQSHRLLFKNLERKRVTALCVAADQLCRLPRPDRVELMVGEPGQPIGQEVELDAGQRGHALGVANEPAVANGQWLILLKQALQRDLYVAQLPSHPRRAMDDPACFDHAAAEAGPHDH